MPLIGVELINEIVQTVIFTGKVEGFDPVSMLLIAAPESGKTSIVKQNDCKALMIFTDITGRGLTDVVSKAGKEMSHIVINDMVAVMSHRQSVNRYMISMLNAMTEEGLSMIAYPGSQETFPIGRRGVIACLTLDLAKDGRSWWHKTGFATRMLPFAYDHSPALTIKIKAAIMKKESHKTTDPQKVLPIPAEPVRVFVAPKWDTEILKLSDAKAVELGEKGYRRLVQYRALVRAHALLKCKDWKKPVVTAHDIEFLHRIQPFINYKDCKPL